MGEPKTPEDHQVCAYQFMRDSGVDQDIISRVVAHMSDACRLAKREGREEAVVEVLQRVARRASSVIDMSMVDPVDAAA